LLRFEEPGEVIDGATPAGRVALVGVGAPEPLVPDDEFRRPAALGTS
jgi:hypothetical protein